MTHEILLSSLAAVPSDYNAPDGQLDLSLNLINEQNALHPVQHPTPVNDPKGLLGNTFFIHQTPNFRHFITLTPSKSDAALQLNWVDAKQPYESHKIGFVSANTRLHSIGNVLITLDSSGMNFYLFKNDPDEPTYINLGRHIPELPISFGLYGTASISDPFDVEFDHMDCPISLLTGTAFQIPEQQRTQITSQILAKVNKFIAGYTAENKFIFPFFLRYAFRLYDGSLSMHSAPILMLTSSGTMPGALWSELLSEKLKDVRIWAMTHKLFFNINNNLSELLKWSDIVKSVDIFITPPIYTYDQNGECSKILNENIYDSLYTVCREVTPIYRPDGWSAQPDTSHRLHTLSEILERVHGSVPTRIIEIPHHSEESIINTIKDSSNFYLLKSYSLDELAEITEGNPTTINIDKDYLQSLLAREHMTDDYDSHTTLIPSSVFNYNSRLNISDIKKRIFDGFKPEAIFPYSSSYISASVYIFIRRDGDDYVIRQSGSIPTQQPISVNGTSFDFPLLYFYYPDPNAYKVLIIDSSLVNNAIELPLEPHPNLNGAVFFNGWTAPKRKNSAHPASSTNTTVYLPNKIYTSEVNNPFFFPLTGITTVGAGQIFAIAAAARPLSQGQFGAFPLYAFSSDGVWALEVSATGTYSARQPITRDVCTNPDSITSLDSSVLFTTKRGLMQLSGSVATCITESIQTETPFDIKSQLRHSAVFHSEDQCLSPLPFLRFLESARIVYDYRNQHVIIFSPGISYAYLFSMKSKEWGMMHSSFTRPINSYPDAFAITTDSQGKQTLVDFSTRKSGHTGVSLLTRPLKLGMPDILKTVTSIILRGNFQRKNIELALYASRDLINWVPVWSSKTAHLHRAGGSPYKYFRIMATGSLARGESLSSFSVAFMPRYNNRLR